MTQEDKEIILKDLCARLLYNVKVQYVRIPPPGWKMTDTHTDGFLTSIEPNWSKDNGYNSIIKCSGTECRIGDIKPYLRPMSSVASLIDAKTFTIMTDLERLDWFNANHIDYRGLIEKGLAIEVTEENNPYKI